MDQVFRIEIPVEATNETDMASFKKLESLLTKLFGEMKEGKTTSTAMFEALSGGAAKASASMQQAESAAEGISDAMQEAGDAATDAGNQQAQAAQTAENAAEQQSDAVSEVGDAYDDAAQAAKGAGDKAGSAFTKAAGDTDKFTQRVEKSEKTLRKMFKEKFELVLTAIDRASPILKSVSATVKGLAGKAWNIAIRMKDFVTAPFRKLYNLISSPITIALSAAGIGFSASDVLSTYNDFESGMSGVQALTGATNEEFQQLKETAKELGAETAFSASEAAEGMQNLGSAGFTTSEIIDAMPGLLDLAASSGEDLASASDIAASTLRGFGLAASEAGHVADVLAQTAAETNATVADTGEAMKYVAPVANAMGLSLEEVAAAIGVMADAGIKGSQAGTTLRGAFSRLAKPTSDMTEIMEKYNLAFYDANGQMKSIPAIVSMLEKSMTGLTDEQRQNALVTLFGQEALSGMLTLLDAGSDKLTTLTQGLEECDGVAEEMADTRLDNLAGDIEELGGAVETAKLELMDKLNPFLRQGVQWLTGKIPEIQTALEKMIDSGIAKAKDLKDFIGGVFNSSEFQNADGFAEKFFVAWDKIIAEPFSEWWNGGGKQQVLDKLAEIGTEGGKLLNGLITGIFAGLKGEEIDAEGLNITGIGEAGAEAASTFVSSFVSALNVGDLFGEMPGLMQAGLVGFGALKIGQGGIGIYKTVNGLVKAFSGLTGAASTAGTATAAVGTQAASAAVGIGKSVSVLGGLKTVLAAIPVWGWVAAAAITATAVGIKLYTDAQEKERQRLLHFSDDAANSVEDFKQTAEKYREYGDTVDAIHEIEIKVKQGENNQKEITDLQAQLAEIKSRKVWLEARLADTTLTEDDIAAYQEELEQIKSRKEYIEAQLASGTLTPEEVESYQRELETLEGREVEVNAALAEGTLTPTDIAAYQSELDALEGREVELNAKLAESRVRQQEVLEYVGELSALKSREEEISVALASGTLSGEEAAQYEKELEVIKSREEEITVSLNGMGVTTLQLAFAESMLNSIDGKTAEAKVVMSDSSLSPDEIDEYATALAEIETRKAEIDLQLTGASLTEEQVSSLKTELQGIENRKAEIEAKIAEGGLTESEIASLSDEYASLESKSAEITMQLSGQGLSQEQLGALVEEYESLTSKSAEITAKMAEAGMSDEDIEAVAAAFAQIGDKTAKLNVSFATGALSTEQIEAYNNELETLYGNLVELSGGYITEKDVESGNVSDELIEEGYAYNRQQMQNTYKQAELDTIRGRDDIEGAVEARSGYQAKYDASVAAESRLEEARRNLLSLDAERQALVTQDEINYETMNSDDYYEWYENTFQPGVQAIQERYESEVAPNLYDDNGILVSDPMAGNFDWLASLDAWSSRVEDLDTAISDQETKTAGYKADYDQQNAALVQQYKNEEAVQTGKIFFDSDYVGMSLEEIAASYGELDAAGQQMFMDAVAALNELNSQTDYIADEDKTHTADIADITAKATIMESVKQQVQDIKDSYTAMTPEMQATFAASEDGAKQLESVNSALESLGLEKIDNLSQLGDALEAINAVDVSDFSLEAISTAFSTLGGDATAAKTLVDNLRAALTNIDGKTATTTLNQVTNKITNEIKNFSSTGRIPKNANGGIYDGAMVSLVAEDGPEAIIPLGAKRRERGLELWLQAGEMLGVAEFAEGGILAPYGGELESLPDDVWNDAEPDSNPSPAPTRNSGSQINRDISVSVQANPVFHIEGGDSEDILDKLRGKQQELAEILGEAFADQLEDIVANMV